MRYGYTGFCSDPECDDEDCIQDCGCGRDRYTSCRFSSCYHCFLDRREGYIECIFCGSWHSAEFATCYECRVSRNYRDDAGTALRQLILWRDNLTCRYCGIRQGEMQIDPRLVRPACSPSCQIRHNHRRPCREKCRRSHQHRALGEPGLCDAKCKTPHQHWLTADDGLRQAVIHVDHIVPCAHGGTADEWNLQALCGVCNIAKGANWWPGCRHEKVKTAVCNTYFMMNRSYFPAEMRARFLREIDAFRLCGTWDPKIQKAALETPEGEAA